MNQFNNTGFLNCSEMIYSLQDEVVWSNNCKTAKQELLAMISRMLTKDAPLIATP
jgi:hypothetical protein